MTEVQAVEAIIQAWRTGWEARQPLVPWTTENEVFETAAAWARISITHTSSAQATMGAPGARRWDRRGIIAVQLFTTPNVGIAVAAGLADDVRAVLEGVRLVAGDAPRELDSGAGQTGGESTDGAWLMRMIALPFRYQQQR